MTSNPIPAPAGTPIDKFEAETEAFLEQARASHTRVSAVDAENAKRRAENTSPWISAADIILYEPQDPILAKLYSDRDLMLYNQNDDCVYWVHCEPWANWWEPEKLSEWLLHLLLKKWFTKKHARKMLMIAGSLSAPVKKASRVGAKG